MDEFTLPHRILKRLNCARFWSQRYVYWDKDSVWNAFYHKEVPIATNDQCFEALKEDVEIMFRYLNRQNKESDEAIKIASFRKKMKTAPRSGTSTFGNGEAGSLCTGIIFRAAESEAGATNPTTFDTPPNNPPKQDAHAGIYKRKVDEKESQSFSPTIMMLRRRKVVSYAIPDDICPTTATSGSLYAPSFHSESSDESLIGRRCKLYRTNYLVGPGDVEWNLSKDSVRWVVSDQDISETCREYRAAIALRCQEMNDLLSADEQLALSHIFVFEEGNALREYFDDDLYKDLFDEFRKIYPFNSIPDRVYELFINIIKISCEKQNLWEHQAAVKQYLQTFQINTDEEDIMVEIFRNLLNNSKALFMKVDIEDTHVHQNIAPVINPFFKNGKTAIDWANKMAQSSALAKRQFDPVLLGTKPDMTVRTTNIRKYIELLIGEMKPPRVRDMLVDEDLVSLGKTMKNSLDKSIEDGVENIVICGLQIIGFRGKAYIIDLMYDGLYRMVLIGEFLLPDSVASWGTVLTCYQVLSTIQSIVNKGAMDYQTETRKNIYQTKAKKMPMTKPMFHSPMRVPIA